MLGRTTSIQHALLLRWSDALERDALVEVLIVANIAVITIIVIAAMYEAFELK